MILSAIAIVAQLAATAGSVLPVLAFPEPGLDDSAKYQGYQTRFFRDAAGNTVQIYLDQRQGRVVHLLADSENGSIGFTARDAGGVAATLRWNGAGAEVSRAGRTRTLEYHLVADGARLQLGWFLLGSMRVERDFQAWERHRAPFTAAPFRLAETDRLLAAIERLPPAERRRQLALLGAQDIQTLRRRLQLTTSTRPADSGWTARIAQPSLDGRDTLSLEVQVDPRRVIAEWSGRALSLRARAGNAVAFTVRITTAAVPLTPLTREEIFTPQFLAFLATARDASRGNTADPAALRARWLERQVRGVELLASREKLMAGLPTYATYFGRDMLVTALMMRPIWRDEMSEFVVASVLRKLSPSGQVSHEEALGGQAVREGAAEYASLVDDHRRAAGERRHAVADSLLARARAVLGNLRRVRENYHMIDDEYQLPVLAARWLGDPDVAPARKRAFLLDSSDGGGTRLARLVRELGLVARTTDAYAANPVATNLVSFPPRDSSRWASTSWRDSNAGYAGGRYAMDVNAIWVPHALESIGRIFDALRTLGFSFDSLARVMPDLAPGTPLGRYGRDPQSLRAAVDSWRGASRHFLVRLSPGELQSFAAARLAAMPGEERDHWRRVLATTTADRDSLTFLALSLDAQGRPIGVANTDGATRLFLGDDESGRGGADSAAAVAVLRDVRLFTLPYPIGLLVDGVGPVVANDAYAPSAVWREFVKDPYHGPRVVWGREVNLFLLGVAHRIAGTSASSGEASRPANPALAAHERTLRAAIERVQAAVQASGFRSELWSYEFRGGRPVAVRYGSGGDVQLWSTTDLVVQFMLSQVSR